MKTAMRKIMALVLALMTMLTMVTSASAASVCKNVQGSIHNTVTFTLKTDSKWYTSNYVKIDFSTGDIKCGDGTELTMYGGFRVYVKGPGQNKYYYVYGSSLKIKGLKANSSYTITVEPLPMYMVCQKHWVKNLLHGGFDKWTRSPSWFIGKTSGVTLCK